jgi:arylsulfatase A-like enzyme
LSSLRYATGVEDVSLRAIRQGRYKYIVTGSWGEAVFDLENDPEERHSIARSDLQRLQAMRTLLDQMTTPRHEN